MHWVLFCLFAIVAWLSAALLVSYGAPLLVSYGAQLISILPYAPVRRWTVIFGAFFAVACPAFSVVMVISSGENWGYFTERIADVYSHVPILALSMLIPFIAFSIGFVFYSIKGFWPCEEGAYQPHAHTWSLREQQKRLGTVLVACLGALLLQDFELRWKLDRFSQESVEMAAAMKPAEGPVESNAAFYYQQLGSLRQDLESWEEEHIGDSWEFEASELDVEETREYLKQMEPIIACLRQASECSECCFEDSFQSLSIFDGLPAMPAIHHALRKMFFSIEQRIQQGDFEADFDVIQLTQQLQRHIQQDPRNVEAVFFWWHEREIQKIVERLSAVDSNLEAKLLRRSMAPPLEVDVIAKNAWKWYVATLKNHLAEAYSGRIYARPEFQQDELWADTSWSGKLQQTAVLFGTRAVFARDDLLAAREYDELLNHSFEEQVWIDFFELGYLKRGKLVNEFLSTGAFRRWITRANTRRTLSNIGLATCLYRQDNGAWPKRLQDLSPDYLPAELAFTDAKRPFFVKSIEGGMMVYSHGYRMSKIFEKYADTTSWWKEAAELQSNEMLFLGSAFEKLEQAEASVNEEDSSLEDDLVDGFEEGEEGVEEVWEEEDDS